MRFLIFLSLLLSLGYSYGWTQEPEPVRLVLQGFLGKEELAQARSTLDRLQAESSQTLIIEINSSSGDLAQVLEIAKRIYELKALKHLQVIVYLDENVIGPAAIIPFLANELYASLFVSWGDIPLGSEGFVPTNILRNRVRSLIEEQNPHASTLYVLADAMTDPNLAVIEDRGWKIARDSKDTTHPQISGPGQPLVVNQNQLRELGLVKEILPLPQFQARYHVKVESLYSDSFNSPTILALKPQIVEDELQKYIHFNPQGPNQVGYIFVGDRETSINESTWLYVKQALDYYKKRVPSFIILHLNTPGGEVFAAQKISDALQEMDTQYNIPIVAVIDNWAISAGAMLAYSCRFITVVKDGSMGAAEPITIDQTGQMAAASEKINSALRSDFASRASFFGRNPLIAEKMVDKDLIIVLRHGKVTKLDTENQIRTTGPEPDLVISPKGKLLTLNADQMKEYGLADLILPTEKLPPITAEEQNAGQWEGSKVALFHTPFFAKIPAATIDAYRMDWKTRFFVLLATPFISSLLFMGLLVGGYMELNHPGLSLPGIIAGLCLFLIILSSFSLQIANWLELILLLTGIALLLVEIFILPTFGLIGVIGLLFFLIGLFGMMLPGISNVHFDYDAHQLNAAGQYLIERLAWLCGSLILSLIIIAFLARYVMPSFGGFNRFVLAGHEQEASKGYYAGDDPNLLPQPGAVGEVLATLRPAGKIMVNDQIFDAISTGDYISAGEKIVVERLDGSYIVVNRLRGSDTV